MQFHPIIVRFSYVNSAASDVSRLRIGPQTLIERLWSRVGPVHAHLA